MGDKFLNGFIAAIFGVLGGIATVWYLEEPDSADHSGDTSVATAATPHSATGTRFDELEVRRLRVTETILVCNSTTQKPEIELRDGGILAKNQIIAETFGGCRMVGQKFQVTPGDPSAAEPTLFGEWATDDEGGGYFALLSPKGTHSLNMGFDKKETGFIISQNNQDQSVVAQAILPLPTRESAAVPANPTPNGVNPVANPSRATAPAAPPYPELPAPHSVPPVGQLSVAPQTPGMF